MYRTVVRCLLCLTLVSLVSAQQWQWPDTPKNLTALPATTGGRDLQRVMFSYTSALGVRCTYCHVGEEGKDFSQFDFVSDAKPAKNAARMMIKMVKEVNGKYLSGLHEDPKDGIAVTCQTCHRGASTPITLEEKLKRTYDIGGLDSTIRQYRALRDQFYGGNTYNFKEGTLLRLADRIAEDSTKMTDAIAVVKLNVELYPAFAFSYTHLGEWYDGMGNTAGAIENYTKAAELTPGPRGEMIRKRLDALKKK